MPKRLRADPGRIKVSLPGRCHQKSWTSPLVLLLVVIAVICASMARVEAESITNQVVPSSPTEVIPPAPTNRFNDYAGVTRPATGEQLNRALADFERQTTCQFVVAVYPKMQTSSTMEDYTVRVFNSWGVGQKNKNNGVVLFVFTGDRKMRIATGSGMEGVLPNPLCQRILDEDITPRFKAGDFDGGLTAGVKAIIAAAKTPH